MLEYLTASVLSELRVSAPATHMKRALIPKIGMF